MRIKVTHLTSAHPVDDIRIFYKECSALAQKGYEVSLVACSDSTYVRDNVRIIGVPKARTRFARMTWTAGRVFLAALRERASIYHLHDPELLPWAQILRLLGKRVIFDMHENLTTDIPTRGWRHPRLGRAAGRIYEALQPFLLANIPVVFAERSYLKHHPWVKQSVEVLNLPLLDRLLPIRESKHPELTLGYFGGVAEQRGSLITLEAMRILQQRGHRVAFECVGPVSEPHKLEMMNLAAKYDLENVRLRGFVRPEEGWRLMARCHVGLAVLAPRPNYIESYPTKVFEYMALGLPVIVSGFPLYSEIVSAAECGLTVDPKNPQELADAVERIIVNPSWATQLGENGRLTVSRAYNWDTERLKLLRFYEDMLQ